MSMQNDRAREDYEERRALDQLSLIARGHKTHISRDTALYLLSRINRRAA